MAPEPAEEKVFHGTTSAQVERVYAVRATTPEQAHDRLRAYFKDADLLREGVVEELVSERRNKTAEKVTAMKEVPKIAAVAPSPAQGKKSDAATG